MTRGKRPPSRSVFCIVQSGTRRRGNRCLYEYFVSPWRGGGSPYRCLELELNAGCRSREEVVIMVALHEDRHDVGIATVATPLSGFLRGGWRLI